MTKLKRCPFCGYKATIWEDPNGEYYIKCNWCGVQLPPASNVESAKTAWNERHWDGKR
jgi:Lar family restriction alleviation protein